MTVFVAPQDTLSDAWAHTVLEVAQAGGKTTNVVTTVLHPLAAERPGVRAIIDRVLEHGPHVGRHRLEPSQSVDTVADTIFSSLYHDPGHAWDPDGDPLLNSQVDAAASELYRQYTQMLPWLTKMPNNTSGTYMGRMISYPGKKPGGNNQLARQVQKLRIEHNAGRRDFNRSDIAIGLEGNDAPEPPTGIQAYNSDDGVGSAYGFPCLVHIDLSLHEGRLHMTALYRHHFLFTKTYGNLVGLSALLRFLCQQTGWPPGELVIVAGTSDCEASSFWSAASLPATLQSIEQAVHA